MDSSILTNTYLNNTQYPTFSGYNYTVWKFRVKAILRERELLALTETQPTEENLTTNSWKTHNAKAMNLIVKCLADSHVDYVVEETTAYNMFQKLDKVFQRKTIGTRIYLRRKLITMMCADNCPLEQFFKEFDTAVRDYKSAGATLDELETIILLMTAMPEKFSPVVIALETLDEDSLTIERVKSRLLECELKNTQKLTNSNTHTHDQLAVAFGAVKKPTCYRCGKYWKKGHRCRKPNQNKTQSYHTSQEKSQNESNMSFAMMSNAYQEQKQEICAILDSGCTDHILNDACLPPQCENLMPTSHSINIAKEGEQMVAKKAGNVKIKTFVNGQEKDVTLHDVLVVDNNRVNMISVSQIDKKGGKVVFENGQATIHMHGSVIGNAKLVNGLYRYNFNINPVSNANVVQRNNETDLWHKRLGHINTLSLCKMVKSRMVNGIDFKTNNNETLCEVCTVSKQSRNPFDGTRTRAKRPLELIHSDVCGPSQDASYDGKRYFVTFIDDWSHMTVVYIIEKKSEVFECFKMYKAMAEAQHNVKVSRIRCDQGGEFSSNEFKNFCKNEGVIMEYTTAYSPQLNGVAERMNRTLVEKGRCLLNQAKLPRLLWGEAILCATYLTNRSITNAIRNKTPYEMWYKSKPVLSGIRVFGCQTFVMVPSQKRSKFDNKSYKCILVGYEKNGYRLYNPEQNGIVYSRDVKFNEHVLGLESLVLEEEVVEYPDVEVVKDNSTVVRTPTATSRYRPIIASTPTITDKPLETSFSPNRTFRNESQFEEVFRTPSVPPTEKRTRFGRTVVPPKRFADYETDYASTHCAYNSVSDVPRDYDDVAGRDDEKLWYDAIKEEIQSLNENETWEIVNNPGKVKLISTRWIFKRKTGTAAKYKARLVAKGFMQKADVDFTETYSPVARLPTIRLLLAVGVQLGMEFCHMDVKTAFLHGIIDEDIYLKPPNGIEVPSNCVLKLKKSLYGLKQSPKCWNDRFDKFITSIGFKRSNADYCLYVKLTDQIRIYIVLYVDDLLMCSNNNAALQTTKSHLASEFRMKDLGEVKCFMGINFKIDNVKGHLEIDQSDYIDNILNKFGMKDCNGIQTPMEPNLKLLKNDDDTKITKHPYRELIGSIMYLMLASRPDLCFAIGYLSRFQDKATDEHWSHLKRLVRYLKQTKNLILTYHRGNATPLTGFVDADWANDTNDRKSTSGFVFRVFGNIVVWSSKKQGMVAKSTSEAEYIAASEACSEAIWLARSSR